VRDLVHVEDLCELLAAQLNRWDRVAGRTYNVGGGSAVCLSLCECTDLCREITGREVPIHSELETLPLDIRAYVTDGSRVMTDTGWSPRTSGRDTLVQIYEWLRDDADRLRSVFQA
jgi:CDP-paratose 2-epimerase